MHHHEEDAGTAFDWTEGDGLYPMREGPHERHLE